MRLWAPRMCKADNYPAWDADDTQVMLGHRSNKNTKSHLHEDLAFSSSEYRPGPLKLSHVFESSENLLKRQILSQCDQGKG